RGRHGSRATTLRDLGDHLRPNYEETDFLQVWTDFFGGLRTVGALDTFQQGSRGQRVFLGTVRLQAVHRNGIADLDGALQGQSPGVGRQEACSEGVTHTGRVDGLVDLGRRHVHARLLAALDPGTLGPQCGDANTDTIQNLAVGPAAFLLG